MRGWDISVSFDKLLAVTINTNIYQAQMRNRTMENLLLLTLCVAMGQGGHAQTVADVEGNTYQTVTIGTQVWMKENLKTTKLYDGTPIANVTTADWGAVSDPAYCWFMNNAASYKNTYGALYNWYAVSTGRLCPSGWHVPSKGEWNTLIDYLGGVAQALPKMRPGGSTYWKNSSVGNNSSGFTALPAGERWMGSPNIFFYLGSNAKWWSSTENDATMAWPLDTDGTGIYQYEVEKKFGCSVRCLKNQNTAVQTTDLIGETLLYPNPAAEMLYVKSSPASNALVMIYDLQGKLWVDELIGDAPIDISHLSKGVYMVKVVDGSKIIVRKLTKQ